ncbi:DNA polymerase III subunit delta [Dermatophilus congolensis]|uniref:DNA-directed DNA polymerase n=1 Tax=Dermatophilus congolensis TaxID=1863 RepID=A0A239VKC0_9MICO|nr:DNA polymerase III subunit delta [Dermatophilus congolensis]MBO3129225.1 DNA polymerase III subunit delta [Dermatophilus congolensis]MBO3132143.1 DNA polymerase III subunit delta [Dermatophilus congolensis]MBO3133701.1 DNA polymerase III subunit delta [Dermatophilus congolensis]MBO3135934.1 DNA polymerase III subunit delta [Dermatophilus congolensis]MBO3138174.1 DNA polymerase III subunit delta [Dermatophilus congolensis]
MTAQRAGRRRAPEPNSGFGGFDDDATIADTPAGGVPPLVLVTGPERVLAQRALEATAIALRATDPQVDIVRFDAEGYEAGSIAMAASPSLFGGRTGIFVRGLEAANDALIEDLVRYLSAPEETVTLAVWHRSGNRGKKVLDMMKKAGARVLTAPAIKSDRDKSEFVSSEFRRAGRRIAPDAVKTLVEAVGKSVDELASACSQLIADTTGAIDTGTVETYYGGRVEANGFKVADAALAGNTAEALALVRHALAVGTDPVPIVAALAVQIRQLIKVTGAPSGSAGQVAGALGMAPWQVDRARRTARGWSEDGLAVAVEAIAAADFAVKGGGRDPQFAVERCVLQVARARHAYTGRGRGR